MVSKGSVHGHVTHHFKPEMRTNITTEGSLWENKMAYFTLVRKQRVVRVSVPASPQWNTPNDLTSSLLESPST